MHERITLQEAKRRDRRAKPSTMSSEDINAAIERLAAMSKLEFARIRKDEAKKLCITPISVLDKAVKSLRQKHGDGKTGQGRGIVLPEPEPWPEEVDGADLLDQMTSAFKRHLALPAGAAEAMALWCLHTYCMDAFQNTPRLALTSPEKRCGKTTALTLINALVWRPLSASNITASAVFRTIEAAQPTLLLDEADTFIKTSDDLRGILNSGHSRANAFVVRTVGNDHEPRQFTTWGPVAIAAIGKIPETLEDRSILIPMRRKTATETVARLQANRLDVFQPLCQQAKRWADDNLIALQNADPEAPDSLHDRAADNWRPLFALADRTGGVWPERVRQIAVALSAAGDDASVKTQLLADIRDILGDDDRIASEDLINQLANMEDRPWAEWKSGKPLSKVQLARLLKPFSITPATIRPTSGSTAKGYTRSSMEEAFARYLDSETSQRHKLHKSAEYLLIRPVTPNSNVTDENRPKPQKSNTCDVVTDKVGGNGARSTLSIFNSPNVTDDSDQQERWAIQEYDGGLNRAEVEEEKEMPPLPEFLRR